jgi:lipoate-protein ligase A
MCLLISIAQKMWYLIDTGFNDPYYNMAYDESLMDYVQGRETVFLRFFNFSPVSISLGYHQKAGKWLEDLESRGMQWVRRRTGGRAVVHSGDCTYSLTFHRENPWIGGNVVDSYAKISLAFKKAFSFMGINTLIKRGALHNRERESPKMCFSSISLADVCWKNKKIIGGAQYRVKNVTLQQGTIMLKNPSGFSLGPGTATIEMALGEEVGLNVLKRFVIKGFEEEFNISFEKYSGNPIKEKILLKYMSDKWNLEGVT